MKILTLWQPWASLIAAKLKCYETRSWETDYRGKLAIHAAKRPVRRDEVLPIEYAIGGGGCTLDELKQMDEVLSQDLPLGCIVAIVDLSDCRMMIDFFDRYSTATTKECRYSIRDQSVLERAVGNWRPGRYAWQLENVLALASPIAFKGAQGLRSLTDPQVLSEIAAQTSQIETEVKSGAT
jgi:activating signal cointegrator 1